MVRNLIVLDLEMDHMRNGSRVFIVVIMAAVMTMELAYSSPAGQKEPIVAGSIHSLKKPFIVILSQSPGIPPGEEVAAVSLGRDAGTAAEALKQCAKNSVTAYPYPRISKMMNEPPKTAAGNMFKKKIDPES